ITDLRKAVQEHVLRLPVSYFDSTKTGVLISRIMTDAEGVRNLVGTGIVQLVGGLLTAMMAVAFKRLRPIFRKRGEINAEVTGRLTESVGGVRIVKVYTAEEREEKT